MIFNYIHNSVQDSKPNEKFHHELIFQIVSSSHRKLQNNKMPSSNPQSLLLEENRNSSDNFVAMNNRCVKS